MNAIVKAQPQSTVMAVQSVEDVIRLADIFAKSGMFQTDNGSQSAAQLVVKIMAGQEIGVAPFAAANGMQIIKGKCSPGANMMAAKVKSSGKYDYRVLRMDDQAVEIAFFQGDTKIGVSAFTIQDAQKAGTQNIQKFPRNMLFARALSNGVKWYCPDIFNGVATYTPDEMGEHGEYNEAGDFIVVESSPVTQPVAQSVHPVSAPIASDQPPAPKPANGNGNGRTSTPHTRLFGEGVQTFSPAKWEEIRPFIVSVVTSGVHDSESALIDEEREMLADSFKSNRKAWQLWARQQGDMPTVAVRPEAVDVESIDEVFA